MSEAVKKITQEEAPAKVKSLSSKKDLQLAWNKEMADKYFFYEEIEIQDKSGDLKTVFYINEALFWEWLSEELGFGIYFREDGMHIIRIQDNIISPQSRETLKNIVFNHFAQEPGMQKKVIKKRGKLLAAESMPFLKDVTEEINPIRDRKDNSYLFFKNGFIEVTADSIGEVKPYAEMDFLIWETDILEYDFSPETYQDFDFFRFCQNITNQDKERLEQLKSVLGYYIHTYKDSANAKAIYLVDEGATPDEANGGSGKTLLMKAIQRVRNTCWEDGKRFSRKNSTFLYQSITESTKVLAIDDLAKNFPVFILFSPITGDMDVERKAKQPFTISFDISPKILLSGNYYLKFADESTKRRFKEFEVHRHYNSDHTPLDDFGRAFFQDWTGTDWNQFFAFMADCVRTFLSDGLIIKPTGKTKEAKLQALAGVGFSEWINESLSLDIEIGESFNEFTSDVLPDQEIPKFIATDPANPIKYDWAFEAYKAYDKEAFAREKGNEKSERMRVSKFLRAFADVNNLRYQDKRVGKKEKQKFFWYESKR